MKYRVGMTDNLSLSYMSFFLFFHLALLLLLFNLGLNASQQEVSLAWKEKSNWVFPINQVIELEPYVSIFSKRLMAFA